MDVSPAELHALYEWVDTIPLSRPKRNIARDFADGCLAAEVVAYYLPGKVQLHNYSQANNLDGKLYNWRTLDAKVFKRVLGVQVPPEDLNAAAMAKQGAVERILKMMRNRLAKVHAREVALAEGEDAQTQAEEHQPYQLQQPPPQPQPQGSFSAPPPPLQVAQRKYNAAQAVTAQPSTHAAREAAARIRELEAENADLREASEILESKVHKLEQLVRLKDAKVQTLQAKLQALGAA